MFIDEIFSEDETPQQGIQQLGEVSVSATAGFWTLVVIAGVAYLVYKYL